MHSAHVVFYQEQGGCHLETNCLLNCFYHLPGLRNWRNPFSFSFLVDYLFGFGKGSDNDGEGSVKQSQQHFLFRILLEDG